MTAVSVHACLRAALTRWAASQGTAPAAAELGVDPSTLRRKRDEGHAWHDREIAAVIAHEIDQAGTSALIADLLACEQQAATLGEPALRTEALALASRAADLVAVITGRLADGHLSPRDAGEIRAALARTRGEMRRVERELDQFLAALPQRGRP